MDTNLYPPTVAGVPPDLTVPSGAYRRQVVIVLISLLVFVLFYISLIVASGWAVVYTIQSGLDTSANQPDHPHDDFPYWIGIIAAVLFVFLIKSLFKWKRTQNDKRIEVTEKDQPILFDYIRRICADTKAPFPYHIYLTDEVNAYVFYNSSILSLFLPVRKNLAIGLGLVNQLNLAEFKAVLAHEFGHFSQSTMRVGSYVYVANHVIYDLVYHRDALDDLLEKSKRTNIRIAIFAWAIFAILWIIRQLLQLVFKLINFFHSALSRQMEFHADLVSVSVTGSDSLIHALKKLEFANACYLQALSDLKHASENKLLTSDIYFHQAQAAAFLRRVRHDPQAGVVPALPADASSVPTVFNRDDNDSDEMEMWASHPSNYDREQNAKRRYIRSVEDDRSSWLLFRNADQVRKQMSELFYRSRLKGTPLTLAEPASVQLFIDSEHEEMTQDERYAEMFDGRLLTLSTEDLAECAFEEALASVTPEQIEATLAKLYRAEYRDWLEDHKMRTELLAVAEVVAEGEVKIKKDQIEVQGNQYSKAELIQMKPTLESQSKQDDAWFKAFDREIFQAHMFMARQCGTDAADLYARYAFHVQIQQMLTVCREQEYLLNGLYRFLSSKQGNLSKEEFASVREQFKTTSSSVRSAFGRTTAIIVPLLQNIAPGTKLSDVLLQEPLVSEFPQGESIDGTWMSTLGRQVSEMETRCRRLYFKSMGAILAHQESIAETYSPGILGSNASAGEAVQSAAHS